VIELPLCVRVASLCDDNANLCEGSFDLCDRSSNLCDAEEVVIAEGNSDESCFMIGEDTDEEMTGDFREFGLDPDYLCDLDGYGRVAKGSISGFFDSGGTSHLCPHIEAFDQISSFKSVINLPNKSKMLVLGKGRVGSLNEVLYVPDLECMVISFGKLDNEGYQIVTYQTKLEAFNAEGELMFTGTLRNGLYYLIL
jgi:hypothetical protein